MHILFEIIGFLILGAISIAILSTLLLVVGVVGLYTTHDLWFAVPLVLGMILASALD